MKEELLDEYYTRDKLIERLKEMGVSPQLLKMPAVIETLLNGRWELSRISVDAKGNILYPKESNKPIKFELQEDGTVIHPRQTINKYGMQERAHFDTIRLFAGEIRGSADEGERKRENIVFFDNSFIAPHDAFPTRHMSHVFPNYPGWEIKRVVEEEASQYPLIIGQTILEYPQIEEWYVENGFLSMDREARNKEIVEAIRSAKERYELMLDEEENSSYIVFNMSLEERLQIIKKNTIEQLRKSIEKCDRMIETYSRGERPVEEAEYTEEQAQENRAEFFIQQTHNYTEKSREIEQQNVRRAQKLAQLQE